MAKVILIITAVVTGFFAPPAAVALKSDSHQPVAIDSDQVDLDFKTGVRTFSGNVHVTQGTIRVNANKLVCHYRDGQLYKALAYGKPAVFRQRPEGKENDVIGKAQQAELNNDKSIVTLLGKASLKQAGDTVVGEKIVYNTVSEKLTVHGSKSISSPRRTSGKAAEPNKTSSGRTRIVIQPNSKITSSQ